MLELAADQLELVVVRLSSDNLGNCTPSGFFFILLIYGFVAAGLQVDKYLGPQLGGQIAKSVF